MFRFKHFSVEQNRCAMKVGTDGVLLGAWVPVRDTDRRVLDIGTGTGLIALMLAQRTAGARITALDVDPACAEQARENADASPWGGRIETVCAPVQAFGAEPFDLIVSNPPFYDNSLPSPDAARTTARHTASLPFAELLDAVGRLLAPEGRPPVPDAGVAVAVARSPDRRADHAPQRRAAFADALRPPSLRDLSGVRGADRADGSRVLHARIPGSHGRFLPEILIWREIIVHLSV